MTLKKIAFENIVEKRENAGYLSTETKLIKIQWHARFWASVG